MVDLIQEAEATVAVVVEVTAGAEAGGLTMTQLSKCGEPIYFFVFYFFPYLLYTLIAASLLNPNLRAARLLDLDQGLGLHPARHQSLALLPGNHIFPQLFIVSITLYGFRYSCCLGLHCSLK